MFAIELGNKICLICTSFEPRYPVNSQEIGFLQTGKRDNWAVPNDFA